jgi:hypothetical protein
LSLTDSTPITDEDILVDALEFDPICEFFNAMTGETCTNIASWLRICKHCDVSAYCCEPCRTRWLEAIQMLPQYSFGCSNCHARCRTWDDLAGFLPIGSTR